MKRALSFLILLMFFQTGFSQDNWIPVGQSKDGAVKIYLKEHSIQKVDGYINCWAKTACSVSYEIEARKSKGKSIKGYDNYSHTLHLYVVDCVNHKYILRKRVDYNKSGMVLEDVMASESEARWIEVLPNTVAETIAGYICNYTFK